jgi:hypothetical protein
MKREVAPLWDAMETGSPLHMYKLVAAQGVSDLLLHRAEEVFSRVEPILVAKLGEKDAGHLADWWYDVADTAAALAAMIAVSLATMPVGTDFEAWLQKAIDTAGLSDYKVPDVVTELKISA